MKRRTITFETSQFSDNPTRRWVFGGDYYEEDAVIEYPDDLDDLDDDALSDAADNERAGVRYIPWGGVCECGTPVLLDDWNQHGACLKCLNKRTDDGD